MTPTKPTRTEYSNIQKAYDHFNKLLFAGALPQVLVTMQRHPKMRGYFWSNQFASRTADNRTDEIALNPDYFVGRKDIDILSTLVHEMAHTWQDKFGKPSRRAYHNQEWATKMKAIGLYPSNTGAPGGKETGEQMTHYIVEGGPFMLAYGKLVAAGFKLGWQATPTMGLGSVGKAPKVPTRAKYSCRGCGLNAWAKPGANLTCGDCEEAMGVQ